MNISSVARDEAVSNAAIWQTQDLIILILTVNTAQFGRCQGMSLAWILRTAPSNVWKNR